MWIEKIRHGVLQVTTPSGMRYVEPTLSERLQLIWTFRNFHVLSEEVMSRHERHLLAQLCAAERLKRNRALDPSPCVIGTVDRLAAFPPPQPARATSTSSSALRSA